MTTATQTLRLADNRERGSHSLRRLVGAAGQTYYSKNKTKILRRAKKQYAALSKSERQKRIEYAINYQKENRARYLEQRRNRCAVSARSWRAEVPENYVRHALSVGSPVKAHQWPQSLVQLKQIQMKVRKLWLHQKTSKN